MFVWSWAQRNILDFTLDADPANRKLFSPLRKLNLFLWLAIVWGRPPMWIIQKEAHGLAKKNLMNWASSCICWLLLMPEWQLWRESVDSWSCFLGSCFNSVMSSRRILAGSCLSYSRNVKTAFPVCLGTVWYDLGYVQAQDRLLINLKCQIVLIVLLF